MCVHTPMPLDHLAAKLGQTGKLLFTRVGRELIRPIWGFSNRFFKKPVIPRLTREFPDLTLAASVKSPNSRPKLTKTQTKQPTAPPRRAACKTSTITRRKTQKTHGSQYAGKARAARSADTATPRGRVRGKPTYATGDSGPRARSRATQTSTDVETSETAQSSAENRTTARTLDGVERNAPSRWRRETAWPNPLREAARVKKPPRTKNNCSSTCWSGGDGLGSPAMVTNEARAARTSSPARWCQARPLVEYAPRRTPCLVAASPPRR